MSFLIKAVEKARKNKSDEKNAHSTDVIGGDGRRIKPGLPSKEDAKQAVEVSYVKTKVQTHDLEKLKNNKIVSIFDDFEVTDQIKHLRTQALKQLKAIRGNSLLVTSANSFEGKTFTSINLGVSISKEFNRSVLIVDADLRKPANGHCALSEDFFTFDVEKGLSDYLKGNADLPEVMINPGISKLVIIPSGKPAENAAELLNSSKMEQLLTEVKSRYPDRLIIIDTPPTNRYTDAVILSRFVHGVLLVVEVEKTSTHDLQQVIKKLKDVPIIGTVLNKAKN